jgi:hypothetical protein
MALDAVLRAAKVPKPVRRPIAYNTKTKAVDKALKRQKTVRKVSEYSKKLKKHLKTEREKATKKNGDFKKGRSMSTVMRAAHKCVAREMRKK